MNLIQAFVGAIVTMSLLILAFFVAWYIVVPLMVAALIFGAGYSLWFRWKTRNALKPVRRRRDTHVIDVEFKEM
ncbi:MAG: hypothetical protein PHX68_04645 [Alphaproteobacteria bacterium]|nr:hypothetical protein [Alphaproteobacteria bacterium]